MKNFFLTLLISIISLASIAQRKVPKIELRAYMDNKQFYAPGVGNYIEIQLQFSGSSIIYLEQEAGIMGELAVQMAVLKGEDTVASDAYRLNSPAVKDSIFDDFYDIKRFVLEPGDYVFKIKMQDLNSDNEPLEASQIIVLDDLSNAISLSDVETIEYAFAGDESSPFYKSGYNIIPRLSTFYPEQLSAIPVYMEIYNSTQLEDTVFGIKRTIVNADLNIELEEYTVFTRHYTAEVVTYLKAIDIAELHTGKYLLNFTLLNKNMMELSTQSYVFERSNDVQIDYSVENMILDPAFQESITEDSVWYYLESLIPISRSAEVKNILKLSKTKDRDKARKYLQIYWLKTAPSNTYEAWMRYKAQVQMVERIYANNFQEGFETDRGRVYLQYGAPTNIIGKEYSPSEYPYEIWKYNKIGAFSNKRFVFYNPDLVNRAYRLLHSDMVGELKNPSWPRELSRRNSPNGNVDNPNSGVQDHWGGNSEDLYNQ
ncbi:MAG: GWxTD domain-containing protein [Crocinitomicaceae bacterium]|nr:GWxTD domain-containing protein [Crocinitomicaceae bacterium]